MKKLCGFLVFVLATAALSIADELPSWRDSANKEKIISFISRITDEKNTGFVKEDDRIAVFDNDGTLMVELPDYAHLAFLKSLKSPESSAIFSWMKRSIYGEYGYLPGLQAGMTSDEYSHRVKEWLSRDRHPRFGELYGACAYQPMLELIRLLRSRNFTIYLCSGSDADFLRAFSQSSFGIPPDRVIGSLPEWNVSASENGLSMLRTDRNANPNLGMHKAVNIHNITGKRPVIAAGNTDNDLHMLLLAQGRGAALGLAVYHDDAEREYAYDEDTSELLAAAKANDWAVVSMKDDWERVFSTSRTNESRPVQSASDTAPSGKL